MAIMYAKRCGEVVYYVYKFKKPYFGVSVTHRNGDTAIISDFSPTLLEAVSFVEYIFQSCIQPVQLKAAAQEYRRISISDGTIRQRIHKKHWLLSCLSGRNVV